MTGQDHNRYLGYTFLANGSLQFVVMSLIAIALLIVSAGTGPGDAPAAFAFIVCLSFLIQIMFVIPSLAAAYGILRRRPWARTAAIAAATLSATQLPLGTLACVYTFWFFCGEKWRTVYDSGGTPLIADEDPVYDISRWTGFSIDERGNYVFRPVEVPDWR